MVKKLFEEEEPEIEQGDSGGSLPVEEDRSCFEEQKSSEDKGVLELEVSSNSSSPIKQQSSPAPKSVEQPIFNIESSGGPDVVLKCTCPRNGCAKAYCICFLNGQNCDPAVCQCTNCLNTGSDQ